MVATVAELVRRADQLLQPDHFQDYCPNGLQVEGRREIGKLVSGVSASLALLEAALADGADAILVHHGYFWKGEEPGITSMKKRRLQLLLKHDISLIAYHLPLDAHPQLGNNAQLAAQLGIETSGGLQPQAARPIGNVGYLREAVEAAAFADRIGRVLGRQPLLIVGGTHPIRTIAWCTGGAQGYIEQAASLGVDAYLSGEISEQTVHAARELGIHYFAAGHHATERYGVAALGAQLAQEFGIEHRFIDSDNPA